MDFLDELAPASVPTQPAQVSPVATEPQSGPDTQVSTEAPVEGTESSEKSKYTNVSATFAEGDKGIPDGLLTVSDFANKLTVRNIVEKNLGADGVVDKSAVYAAMRAVRNPLPVVLVGDTAWLSPDAVAVWDERPARGEGAERQSRESRDQEHLFRRGPGRQTTRPVPPSRCVCGHAA